MLQAPRLDALPLAVAASPFEGTTRLGPLARRLHEQCTADSAHANGHDARQQHGRPQPCRLDLRQLHALQVQRALDGRGQPVSREERVRAPAATVVGRPLLELLPMTTAENLLDNLGTPQPSLVESVPCLLQGNLGKDRQGAAEQKARAVEGQEASARALCDRQEATEPQGLLLGVPTFATRRVEPQPSQGFGQRGQRSGLRGVLRRSPPCR